MPSARGCLGLTVGLVSLASAACIGIGPKTIPKDRVEYAQALRD